MQQKLVVIVRWKALLSALEASKHTFPDEFIGLFRGTEKKGVLRLNELIIPPFSTYHEDWAGYSPWFLPPKMDCLASFHSHTRGPALPSREDLRNFAGMGRAHFISVPPFTPESTNCFDSTGRKIVFELK
ncbi:MAG: Mov34/MPN/PAD-1 family protein [Candidatus Micrarchaeia archaeon]